MEESIKDMSQPRGRPINTTKQSIQKTKLLEAAEQLLAEKSYINITIRELAQRSGVNSAMISYYFDNKEGLFLALLDEMSKAHFVVMKSVNASENPIKTFIELILAMLNKNNGLAKLIHSEFLNGSSELSDAFIERFPKKMATFLPKLIQRHTGTKDFTKAKYAAFSLITLIITPFINKSIRQVAWEISDEELQEPLWAEHVYHQFMYGCNILNTPVDKTINSVNLEEVSKQENVA